MRGVKHLIECHCTLPQFRDSRNPVYHRFIVFSEFDRNENVIPKYAQCNNCGVIHRVTDILKSEILTGNDTSVSIVGINDIKLSLPAGAVTVLESYNVDLPTWEEVASILENELWDSTVALTTESKDGITEGKCLRIKGRAALRVEPYSINTAFPPR